MDKIIRNEFHYRLELPFKFNLSDFLISYDDQHPQHNSYDINNINQDFRNWLSNLNVKIEIAEQFILDPKRTSKWVVHIDGVPPYNSNHVKMNFVFCEEPHYMNWYELKDNCKTNIESTDIGTEYCWAEKDDCNLLYSAKIGTPSLVNVSLLHNVSEVTALRYCYSLTLRKLNNNSNERLSWKEAPEIFKNYIVET